MTLHQTAGRIHRGLPAIFLLLALAGGMLTGCKPTEKNYRSAYDAARAKREREDSLRQARVADLGLDSKGGTGMEEVDGARRTTIRGREVWLRSETFVRADSVKAYSVSAATFKMPSNATAMAADLRADGFPAARAAQGKDAWFVLIGESDALDPALDIYGTWMDTRRDAPTVGQPGLLLLKGGSPK